MAASSGFEQKPLERGEHDGEVQRRARLVGVVALLSEVQVAEGRRSSSGRLLRGRLRVLRLSTGGGLELQLRSPEYFGCAFV
jgi:hypothetical protein